MDFCKAFAKLLDRLPIWFCMDVCTAWLIAVAIWVAICAAASWNILLIFCCRYGSTVFVR